MIFLDSKKRRGNCTVIVVDALSARQLIEGWLWLFDHCTRRKIQQISTFNSSQFFDQVLYDSPSFNLNSHREKKKSKKV